MAPTPLRRWWRVASGTLLVAASAVIGGGLEAPIALHTVGDMPAFLPGAAPESLGAALEQGAAPWQSLVGRGLPLVAFAVTVVILVRKRELQTESR